MRVCAREARGVSGGGGCFEGGRILNNQDGERLVVLKGAEKMEDIVIYTKGYISTTRPSGC